MNHGKLAFMEEIMKKIEAAERRIQQLEGGRHIPVAEYVPNENSTKTDRLLISVQKFARCYMDLVEARCPEGFPYYINNNRIQRLEIIDLPDDWKAYIDSLPIVLPVVNVPKRKVSKFIQFEKFESTDPVVKFKNKAKNSKWDRMVESQRLNK